MLNRVPKSWKISHAHEDEGGVSLNLTLAPSLITNQMNNLHPILQRTSLNQILMRNSRRRLLWQSSTPSYQQLLLAHPLWLSDNLSKHQNAKATIVIT